MKERRFARYLQKRRHPGKAIETQEAVKANPDNHIDQDFPGFPHGTASEEVINPVSKNEKKVSRADKTAKENRVQP